MKYRITKENIEFISGAEEQPALVRAMVEVVIPTRTNKLYFYSPEIRVREAVANIAIETLIVLDDSSVETIHRYKRILHYNGCTTLVPVLSGIVKRNEWYILCEKISGLYNKNT